MPNSGLFEGAEYIFTTVKKSIGERSLSFKNISPREFSQYALLGRRNDTLAHGIHG